MNPTRSSKIHTITLKIYDLLFKSYDVAQTNNFNLKKQSDFIKDLDIYSIGLFPFFSYANNECKVLFLTLITNYFVPLKENLIPLLPGLLQSLLQGLDQNQDLINGRSLINSENSLIINRSVFHFQLNTRCARQVRFLLKFVDYRPKRFHLQDKRFNLLGQKHP